jgi:hypothetical protein
VKFRTHLRRRLRLLIGTSNEFHSENGVFGLIGIQEALKGAQSIEYRLDKKNSPFPDLIDAYRLAMKYFYLTKE